MQREPEIAFRGVQPTQKVEDQIREGIESLERAYDDLIGCRIAVEVPDHRHRTGNRYRIRIEMSVPGHDVVVDRAPAEHPAQEYLDQAIGEAFDRARRRLIEHAERIRGDVKTHETPSHGRVVRLLPEYGFIETSDGAEVYFHRNSLVSGGFDDLEQGAELRFVLEQGDEGPQATSVRAVGKHHPT